MPKKITKMATIPQDDNLLLQEWWEKSKALAVLKDEENQLRQVVVMRFPFNKEKLEGTESIDIGQGWRLKATKNMNYSATNESGQTVAMLNAIGAIDPGTAAGLVKWKPELSTTVARKLSELAAAHPALAVLIAAAVTVKPGMPELEIVAPKAEPAPVVIENISDTGATTMDGNFPKGF